MLGLGLKTSSNRSDRFGLPVGPVRLCQNWFNFQILNFKHRGVTDCRTAMSSSSHSLGNLPLTSL